MNAYPNTSVPDGLWSFLCVNSPAQNEPCAAIGDSYDAYQSSRSRHPGGVNGCLADASVRFFSSTIDLATWNGLGTKVRGETLGSF